MLDKKRRILVIIVLTLGFLVLSNGLRAQNVQLKGNTFVEQNDSSKKKSGATKTQYMYTDSKGNTYPVFLSSNGNAFIIKTSKSGNEYRKYLPQITEKLGTKKQKR